MITDIPSLLPTLVYITLIYVCSSHTDAEMMRKLGLDYGEHQFAICHITYDKRVRYCPLQNILSAENSIKFCHNFHSIYSFSEI